jgi:hypothetical protein
VEADTAVEDDTAAAAWERVGRPTGVEVARLAASLTVAVEQAAVPP